MSCDMKDSNVWDHTLGNAVLDKVSAQDDEQANNMTDSKEEKFGIGDFDDQNRTAKTENHLMDIATSTR